MLHHVEHQDAIERSGGIGQALGVGTVHPDRGRLIPGRLTAELHRHLGIVHAIRARAESGDVAQNLAASAAHVQHLHAGLHFGVGKRFAQAARQALALRFDKFFITLAGIEEVVLRVQR